MPAARLIKQGVTSYAQVLEIEREYREKNLQLGKRKYEVWRMRRGPGEYAYEVYEL